MTVVSRPAGDPVSVRSPHEGGDRLPGLDGLRAVAVAGVLAYHADVAWMRGGYLGVSLFFTLSGFLITRLLIAERARHGAIDLPRFFRRRFRRLLPAALAGIALAVVVTSTTGSAAARRGLPGDVLAAMGYVTNWWSALGGQSYASLFDAPSAFAHFWSLAVEEQWYLIAPVLLGALFAHVPSRRRIALILGSVGAVLAVGAALVSFDLAYFGTQSRAVELLVGVVLALLVSVPDRPAPRIVQRAAPAFAGLILAAWATVSLTDPALFRGILVVHAVFVALVIWAVTDPASRVGRVLEAPALVWLGRRSYGVYLYHWPLFLAARALAPSGQESVYVAGATVLSLAMAAASFRYLETPMQQERPDQAVVRRRVAMGSAIGLVAVALLVQTTTAVPEDPAATADALAALLESAPPSPTDTPDATSPPGPGGAPGLAPLPVPGTAGANAADGSDGFVADVAVPATPPRIAFFGDSLASTTGLGVARWGLASGTIVPVAGVAIPGCPLVIDGGRLFNERVLEVPSGCDWKRSWFDAVDAGDVEVMVVNIGTIDTLDWYLRDGTVTFLGEDYPDRRVDEEIAAIHAEAASRDVTVVWLTVPAQANESAAADPTRVEELNARIRARAALDPDVHVVDVAAEMATWTAARNDAERPDGVHLTEEAAQRFAETWLGPELLAIAAGRGR